MNEDARFIGLISGTSRDGVDAVLVRFDRDLPILEEALCLPYPDALASALQRLIASTHRPRSGDTEHTDALLADHFTTAALGLLQAAGVTPSEVRAIGSHGQTVWHDPDGPDPASIQLADPARIARKTGICTVGDFRRADIEAGGQGAPLAPLLHCALFRPAAGRRAVLNLGGIANVSLLGSDGIVGGYDTGPANCLLDGWVRAQRDEAYDRNGLWASGGTILETMLDAMLRDPWFAKPPPKSTGVEYFNLRWLRQFLPTPAPASRDVQATLSELTARSVASAIRRFGAGEVLVCGGGVHNADLLRRLSLCLADVRVASTAEYGLDPDWVEAVLFAWLARERLAGRHQDTRRITGAEHPVLLGVIYDPQG